MCPGLFAKCLLFILSVVHRDFRKAEITGYAQGTAYHITYYAPDSVVTKKQIDSIFDKIDTSLSLYNPNSLITRFNVSEKGIEVDDHFKAVFNKSQEVYQATSGLFDITIQPLVEAWGFGIREIDGMPNDSTLAQLKSCVGSHLLVLKDHFLSKKKSCVAVDMNGIAQGYSVDVIADFLEQYGIFNYVIELGGELRVKGKNHSGEKFKIGIESPAENEFDNKLTTILSVDSGAITTSGSYRKYYESNGKKLSHLINPSTGYPAQNELISVTVYAKDGITADAFDNALMLMGVNNALEFVEERDDLEAYFIYKNSDGVIADTASRGFYKKLNR